ncbi:MAG TPA: AMP-binding protein, partial [Gemmatimonadaceae bacterium]|nr:AMP-binding protein [Gemmatimonadaceae bacterium]
MTQMEARGGPRPKPGTLNQLFFDAVAKFNRPDALQAKTGGVYKPISHKEVADRVRHAARGLSSLGVRRGDRVAILSENRPEWAIADFACLTAGMTDVPIYPTVPPDQIAYILKDSGAVAIFVSNKAQAEKIREIRGQCPALKSVISFDEIPGLTNMSIAELEKRGTQGDNQETISAYR